MAKAVEVTLVRGDETYQSDDPALTVQLLASGWRAEKPAQIAKQQHAATQAAAPAPAPETKVADTKSETAK